MIILKKSDFNNQLFEFIDVATCSFTCVDTIKKKFIHSGYLQLYENEKWDFKCGKFFVIRNDASIIVFNIGGQYNESFNIICSHCDTPGFGLKPNCEIFDCNYLKMNVIPYGGILNYGWMDRPLSMSGRIIYKEGNEYKKRIVNLKEPICVIPSQAIHQNEHANTNLDLNTQIDMIPIIGLKNEKNFINNLLKTKEGLDSSVEICDYDLFLHTNDKPMYIGMNNEMILSPRLDDLSCTFSLIKSFTETNNDKNINVMCIFNSEEIGSLTKEGADSSFLTDVLKRICSLLNLDISVSLHNSIIVSADNSHAIHPNHPNKSDTNNHGFLNKGILIVKEKDTTTDGISSSIFKEICKKVNVPFQDYTSRNDLNAGTTLSGLCVRHVSIDSVDVGLPQLAMHSANEVIGSDDVFYLYKSFKQFYKVSIKYDRDCIKIIE